MSREAWEARVVELERKRVARIGMARAWNGNVEPVKITSGGVEGHAVPARGTGLHIAGAEVAPVTPDCGKPVDRLAGVESGPLTDTPEREVQADILRALSAHPRVSWAKRMNTGAAKLKGFYVRFGFPGLSDVIGQLIDGRFLAVECKRAGKKATSEQATFLATVNACGGIGFVAYSANDVIRALTDREAA